MDHRNPHKGIALVKFAAILAKDMLNNQFSKNCSANNTVFRTEFPSPPVQSKVGLSVTVDYVREHTTLEDESLISALTSSLNSPPGTSSSKSSAGTPKNNLRDCFEGHDLVQCMEVETYYKRDKDDKLRVAERRKRGRCKACKNKTTYYCPKCKAIGSTNRAWYCQALTQTGPQCAVIHKRSVEDEECKKIPGCSGWISTQSKW